MTKKQIRTVIEMIRAGTAGLTVVSKESEKFVQAFEILCLFCDESDTNLKFVGDIY